MFDLVFRPLVRKSVADEFGGLAKRVEQVLREYGSELNSLTITNTLSIGVLVFIGLSHSLLDSASDVV